MKRTTIGLDIAKRVFQAHAVDPESGEVRRTKLQRGEVLRHFAQLLPSHVAIEACGSAQHWAREIRKLGHEVRLISPQFVRPFVKTNKTDAADAQAIWTATSEPPYLTGLVKPGRASRRSKDALRHQGQLASRGRWHESGADGILHHVPDDFLDLSRRHVVQASLHRARYRVEVFQRARAP